MELKFSTLEYKMQSHIAEVTTETPRLSLANYYEIKKARAKEYTIVQVAYLWMARAAALRSRATALTAASPRRTSRPPPSGRRPST
jgi:hypothetical protein